MKICVTGGRTFDDWDYVRRALNSASLGPIGFPHPRSPLTHIIHGGAKGADTLAGRWAQENGIQEVVCKANWPKFDLGAGPIRNQWMLDLLDPHSDCLIVCPGGKGTQNCLNKAVELGIFVYRYYHTREQDDIIHNMMRIAQNGEEEADQAPEVAEAHWPDGEAVPEPDAPVRAIPADVGDGVFNPRLGLRVWGGGGQAQEANPGGLQPAQPNHGNGAVRLGQVPL